MGKIIDMRGMTRLSLLGGWLMAVACSPVVQPFQPPSAPMAGNIQDEIYQTPDGRALPLRIWPDPDRTAPPSCAVVLALHGFNDYRAAFDWSAPLLADWGVRVYAYDQRGFGENPRAGIWAGADALRADAQALIGLLKARHPDLPVILLGESMGAAVSVLALAQDDKSPKADGAVLVSPAAWGWSEMPFFYRMSLWLAAHIAPGWELTGQGLKRVASDNREALIKMGRDPHVIKATRVDAIYGLVSLMEQAMQAARRLDVPTLVLIGEKDEILPIEAIEAIAHTIPEEQRIIRRYADGYHLLLRDLQRDDVVSDIVAFINDLDGYDRRCQKTVQKIPPENALE